MTREKYRDGRAWLCKVCEAVSPNAEILTAPHPFAEGDICGCPKCREAESLVRACDAEGCDREATMGTPTPDGYRHTCYDHRPE